MLAEVNQFAPNSENTRQLRDAFGRFSTGVTVITTVSDEGIVGITANSFSSLSLDPALVLWSPAKSSKRFKFFAQPKYFAIHVLGAENKNICERFAKHDWSFDGIDHDLNTHGVPLIRNCLARFECRHVDTYPGGDHVIVVGEVENVEMREGKPLAFYAGKYSGITSE